MAVKSGSTKGIPAHAGSPSSKSASGRAPPPKAPVRKSLEHRTISSAVAGELRRRVIDGHFPAGFQLRQDALANEFGVSRIPIREALMQLEAEGLVKIHPHRGASVVGLSPAEILELFELRALLEPRLLRASAPHLTSADYTKLQTILQEYSTELRAQHVIRWGELNTELHMLLYSHAGQPRAMAIVANMLQECDRHTRLQLSLSGKMERAEDEHAEMVRLCLAGDIEAACTLLKAHIENVSRSLLDHLVTQDGATKPSAAGKIGAAKEPAKRKVARPVKAVKTVKVAKPASQHKSAKLAKPVRSVTAAKTEENDQPDTGQGTADRESAA